MCARRIVTRYAVVMIGCAVWLLAAPTSSAALASIGAASAGAVILGIRLYRPVHAGSWVAIAIAVVLEAASRIVYDRLPGEAVAEKPWAWIAWVMSLGAVVFMIAGVLGLIRSTLRGISGAIDAAIIVLGSGLVAGVIIAIPYARGPGIGELIGTIRVGYVARDVLILALAIHLSTAVRWSTSVALFATGLSASIVYDVLFRIGQIRGQFWENSAIDLLWIVFFLGVGGAALDESMTRFDTPLSTARRDASPVRLGLVAVLALMPSAVLLLGLFRKPPWYQPAIVVAATLIVILALARIADVAVQLRRQVRGERVLRETVTDLAAAPDEPSIGPILERAVRRLVGPSTDFRLRLARVPEVPRDDSPADLFTYSSASNASALTAATDRHGSAMSAFPMTDATSRASRRATEDSENNEAADSESDEAADGESGRAADGRNDNSVGGAGVPDGPTLLVQADSGVLDGLRPRLNVLAAQAGFALERIRLNEENVRHISESYFRTLVQNSADIILIIDDDNRIRYASPSAASVFGLLPLRGVRLPELVEEPDRAAAEQLLDRVRAETHDPAARDPMRTESISETDWTLRSGGTAPVLTEVVCRDLREDPSIGGVVVTLRNVTQQRLLEHELTLRAFHDPLTGLGNRIPFSERLDALFEQTADAGELLAVVYADIDDLKTINDALGHDTGDVVLKTVGDRLQEFAASTNIRGESMAARLGGDEFALLLAPVASPDVADAHAARLLDVLSKPVRIAAHEVTAGASVGVATTEVDAITGQDLLRNADLALYAAKGTGKGQWRHYEPWMRGTVMARLELRSSLERAIQDDALRVEYQPIVSLSDGLPVGFEALLRWEHPTRGRLSPDQFIDVAEESGLIVPIGEWVLGKALSAAENWSGGDSIAPPYVAVNVSARQFRALGFTGTVDRLLQRSELQPDRLTLEITESLLLRDDETVWRDLEHVRGTGVRIAIDDFGTGYSALSYLRQVPLDVIKLDRSFIHSIGRSAKQRELVRGIVGLADVLGLQVVAEGIETEEERKEAAQIGCAFGQGYLFSPPLPATDVRTWLKRTYPDGTPAPRRPNGRPTDL